MGGKTLLITIQSHFMEKKVGIFGLEPKQQQSKCCMLTITSYPIKNLYTSSRITRGCKEFYRNSKRTLCRETAIYINQFHTLQIY